MNGNGGLSVGRLTYDSVVVGNHCWQINGADNELCETICKERDELGNGCNGCPIAAAFDKLADYEEAEAQGRLVMLAVNIGGSVWWNDRSGLHYDPKELRITSASVGSEGIFEYGTWGGNFTPCFVRAEDFGKTCFLTRAEAEAALQANGDAS